MKLFGLIGKSLSHSFSHSYFTQKFVAEELVDCQYKNFELEEIHQLKNLIKRHPEIIGLNVTIPYKEAVMPFLQEIDAAVKIIGACNCIKIKEGKLTGFNTDVVGFKQSLTPILKPFHAAALVLGSGGASKAVQFVLSQLGIKFLVVSRTASKGFISYEELTQEIMKTHLLIINTTPLGMHPNIEKSPGLPYQFLTENHLLYDLIYNPATTKFLAGGLERGAQICNGHQMLLLQAEESWAIWNDPGR